MAAKRTRAALKWLGISLGGLLAAGLVFDLWVFPLPVERLHRPNARFVYSRERIMLSGFTASDRFWRKPVKLDDISPALIQSVIVWEDRWFYFHPGINPVSILSAAVDNIRAGKVVRGGSTITMQVARMMEGRPRTFTSKFIEILRALQIEWHYSKDEILEIYFNMVPYGGNMEGVGAASLFYFDKEPSRLSLSECTILTAIPVSPSRYRPDRDTALCRDRRDHVLEYLVQQKVIPSDDYQQALTEEIPGNRYEMPSVAPHFCQSVTSACADSVILNSTINFEMQSICERLAKQHYARLTPKDIHNLSVVVLDNASGDILAMVGSPNFNDRQHGGQINGAFAARSPGSTLKPFAYALAFDMGLISPLSRLADIPVNYAGYRPENYDEQYHGVVSVREALIQSLNVPAVNVTSNVGLVELYTFLKYAGVSTLNRKYFDYGLPLVLGACEVNLVELSNLYATFARRGVCRDVSFLLTHDTTVESRQLLSEESCFLISEILVDLKRPDLPSSWEFAADLPKIAWKTGTSYGRKDAWAIGYNPRYTVGVWAGNFDGAGSVDIVGAEIAAPVMFDIFHEMSHGTNAPWFETPPAVGTRSVCAVSGKLPGEFCGETVTERFIMDKSPAQICDVHRQIMVDRLTGNRLCRFCCSARPHREVIVEQWPAKVAAWLENAGWSAPVPPHNPDCSGMLLADGPVITSPEKNAVYELHDDVPSQYQQILLEAATPAGCQKIHWFVDRQLYQTCPAGSRIFYVPQRGKHSLLCLDDQGRSQTINFEVK